MRNFNWQAALEPFLFARDAIGALVEHLCEVGDRWTFCKPSPEEEARWAALEGKQARADIETGNRMVAMREEAERFHAERIARTVEGREKYGLTWDGRIKNG